MPHDDGEPAAGEGRSALAEATFDSLARWVDEARRYARMLHFGRNSGVWDPVWFGVPDSEDEWPAWLTSAGDDYAAASEVAPELVSVSFAGAYRLRLKFADGTTGTVDITPHLWGPAFRPLHDPAYFAQVQLLNGTATWPNGADLAPEVLYREALRNPLEYDIIADLNMEDDHGRNLGRPSGGQPLAPGDLATAGRAGSWSWVVVEEVEDGIVFFHQVTRSDAARLRLRDRPGQDEDGDA